MIKHFLILTTFFLLYSCAQDNKKSESIDIERIMGLLNSEKPEIDTLIVDTSYLRAFEQGAYQEILNKWKFKGASDFLSAKYDFRKGIYLISLIEVNGEANMSVPLSFYPDNYYKLLNFKRPVCIYHSELLEESGPYTLAAILVYDFMNYKKYNRWNYALYSSFSSKAEESNLFLEIETNFRHPYTTVDSSYIRQIKNTYPHWSYIDSLILYYEEANTYNK